MQPIAYKVDRFYSNDVDLLDIVMELFSITVLKKQLSLRERTVLRDYMKDGYSSRTKASLKLSLEISSANLNTINHTLQKKGFLKPHPTNQRIKVLNEDLTNLKDCFIKETDGKKVFLINFVKNNG